MPRSTRKKTQVKKKTATKPATKRTAPKKSEFDEWATSLKDVNTRCSVCCDPEVTETLTALLNAMIRKRAFRITIRAIREAVLKKHPSADIGQRGMERHLRNCQRDLYARARGRRNG